METLQRTQQHLLESVWDSDTDSVEEVEHFMYKQELSRKLSMGSVLGLSVSIMSVPLGISTTMIVGLVNGGGATIFWGWVLVSLLSLCVTMSLGEMSGKFPTNGGVYHWSYILAPRKVKKVNNFNLIMSWFVGWFLIVGNMTMAVSIIYSGAQFFLSIFGIADTSYHPHLWLTFIVYSLLVGVCLLLNLKFSSWLDTINYVSVYWCILTVAIIDILLLLFSKEFNDLTQVLTTFQRPRSGWPSAIAFFVGLQQAAFTLQGYGMIPSMSEEVKTPEKTIPKGMVYSVCIAGVTGIIFILPILACTPELDVLLNIESNILPIEIIFKASSQSLIISFFFVILLCGTIFFGSIGIFTISSRSVYTLARDNGLPYSSLWVHVDESDSNKIPNYALYFTGIWIVALGVTTLVSPTILYSFMGTSVVCLSISNFVPILLSTINKRRKVKGGSFKVKKPFSYLFNGVSLVWCSAMVIIFSLPITVKVTTITMNYSSAISLIATIAITCLWFGFGKNNFHGPEIDESFQLSQGYALVDTPAQGNVAPEPAKDETELQDVQDSPNLLGDTPNIEEFVHDSDLESESGDGQESH